MLTAEDGLADSLRPRLDRLGADVDRIFGVEDLLDLSSAEGLSTLERAVADRRPRLVIIDPVVAYVGARTDLHRANQVRAVLGPLTRLAAKTRIVILAIRHLNKTQRIEATLERHGAAATLRALGERPRGFEGGPGAPHL